MWMHLQDLKSAASICTSQSESNANNSSLESDFAAADFTRAGWVGVRRVGQVGAGSNLEGKYGGVARDSA